MKKVFIFDYDGVIVDSLKIVTEIFVSILPKYNIQNIKNEKDIIDLFDKNFYESLKELGLNKKRTREIINYQKKELESKKNEISLFNGIKNTLKKLSKENKVIIITSGITSVVRKKLESQNINEIKEILGADKGTSKVKKINIIKKKYPSSKFYYIGDTIGDIFEGKKAEVKTVAVTWGYHSLPKLKRSHPDIIINSPEDLLKI